MKQINKKLNKLNSAFFLLLFLGLLLVGIASYRDSRAKTLIQEYYYDLIEVGIQINQDSTFEVIEKQTFNLVGSFGFFYRDIELKNLDHISAIEVFDSQGNKLNRTEYQVSHQSNRIHIQWDFARRDFDNELKSWTVKYKVYGGLGFYQNWDELYWNAIFEDRQVTVKRAEVMVRLPKKFNANQIDQKLFIGPMGSKNESSNYQIVTNQTVKFWANNIAPHNYLTIVVTWPKGVVTKPFLYRNQLINWLVMLLALALPVFTFVKMFIVWRKKGQDPKIDKSIVPEYSPPENLPPAIFGVLMDQTVHLKDIIATVIDLAVRSYLRIVEKDKKWIFFGQKEYVFIKEKDENDLKPYEQKVIRSIFKDKDTIFTDDLKNEFYKDIPDITRLLHQEVSKTGYFQGNIESVREKYGKSFFYALGVGLVIFLAYLLVSFVLQTGFLRYIVQLIILEVSVMVSIIIVVIFSHYMPALTQKGLEAKWKLLGFKDYLQIAERFRIGAETVDTFSKFLPYALILGVEKKWANRFADIAYQEQNWYAPIYLSGGVGGKAGTQPSFNSFSASISSFSSSLSGTFSRSGGSGMGGVGGGGGGAGGGGGGGGGGAG